MSDMSATLDKFVEEFRSLEPEEQGRLLEMLKREKRNSEREALARSIMGKYAHLPTGSEEFIALKRQEIELEDSKFRNHR
jgi:hypothetical protein